MRLFEICHSDEINERPKGCRHLPPDGVVEIEAAVVGAPVFKNPDEPSLADVCFDLFFERVGYARAKKCSIDHHVLVVDLCPQPEGRGGSHRVR